MKKLFLTAMCLFMLAGYAIAGEKENLEKRWVELSALKVSAEKQFVDVSIEMRQVAARYQAVLAAEKKAEEAKAKDSKKKK